MKRFASALVAVLATLALAGTVKAQAVHLDQYRSAETAEDGFAISRPDDLGHFRWSAQLHLDYGLDPLVYEAMLGDSSTERALIEHQLAAQASFALGLFDRLVLFAGLPVNLVMEGEEVAGVGRPDGAGLGDIYLGARAAVRRAHRPLRPRPAAHGHLPHRAGGELVDALQR